MEIKNTIKRLKETSKQLQEDMDEAYEMTYGLYVDLKLARRSLNLTIKNLETALENLYDYQGN